LYNLGWGIKKANISAAAKFVESMFFFSGSSKKSHVKFLGFVFALKLNKTTRALIVVLLKLIIN